MDTKKESAVASVVFEDDDFTPIVVEEVRENPQVKVTPKKDFKIRIGKNQFTFHKDKPQYVSTFEDEIIRKDISRVY